MRHFSETPEAVDFIAYQSWLSPDDQPAPRPYALPTARLTPALRPREAWRQIRDILRRTSFRRIIA